MAYPQHSLGKTGESLVVQFLQDQGFCILEKNLKKFYGEIDIIAQKGDLVSFIEVKTRKNPRTSMHHTITPAQKNKIMRVAQSYIGQHADNFQDVTYRFDVALICFCNDTYAIDYIPNAFNVAEF